MEMPVEGSVHGRDGDDMSLTVRQIQHNASIYPRKAGTPKSKPLGL